MRLFRSLLAIILIAVFSVVSFAATNPVIEAVATGDPAKVKEALASNPMIDVDERDSFGGTALHGAMFKRNAEITLLLIEHGYDVNAVGPASGYTPLHDAVWAGYSDGVKILVEHGADLSIKNHDGQTALEKAIEDGKKEIADYLEQAAAKNRETGRISDIDQIWSKLMRVPSFSCFLPV
jgi:ankyrin repeat protein